MVSIKEYAYISGHVYNSHLKNYLGQPFGRFDAALLKKGEKIASGWNLLLHVDSHMHEANNLFAALYIKFKAGKATDAVVAIRGTDLSKTDNIITDILSWYSAAIGTNWHDEIPHYLADAIDFYENAVEYVSAHFPEIAAEDIRVTGHSLGGAIAQLLSFRCYFVPCVVFNSPSCRGMAGSEAGSLWSLVVNVNSHYGIINKLGGLPLGLVNVVNVTEMEAEAKSMFQHFRTGEFKAGQKLEQVAEELASNPAQKALADIAGGGLHIDAALSAGSGLDQLPKEHMEIVHCEGPQQYESFAQMLNTISKDRGCDYYVTLSAMANTILAQHKISHVIEALNHTPKVAGVMV